MVAGSGGKSPPPLTKMLNVGVAPAVTGEVTLGAGGDRQAPVPGFVSQMNREMGSVALPVPTVTVISPLPPIFTAVIANALAPEAPGSLTIPSPLGVAANATMSGTGASDVDKSSVFRPVVTGAGLVLAQSKASFTSVGANALVGVKAIRYVCIAPAAIFAGVFGVPTSAFLAGSVV